MMAILGSRTKTGISWISESIGLIKQAPRKWLFIALVYLAIFVFIPSIPGFQLFALLTIIIWPVFIAIAIRMYRNEEVKKTENISIIMQLIQPKMKKLLLLGFLTLIYFIGVSLLFSSDAHVLAEILNKQTQMTEQEMATAMQTIMPILLKLMLMFVPLMIAVWFAPMLIAFHDYSVIKALKSSVAGAIQYVISLTAAWLLLSGAIITMMIIASVVVGLFSFMQPAIVQTLMSFLLFGCFLISVALTLAFQYVSYRDIFRAAPTA
ncbi:MAG TPA: BPSS1780 family membrane protein [Methylophilaceae bacterium]|nr:BPSS1780 family membrane protein [Methylophilaceae bacterium]